MFIEIRICGYDCLSHCSYTYIPFFTKYFFILFLFPIQVIEIIQYKKFSLIKSDSFGCGFQND